MILPFVCFSVCLSARLLKKLSTDFDEIFGGLGCGSSNSRLAFGDNVDHDLDPQFLDRDHNPGPGLFKGFFVYCCDFYRQSRIKRDAPRWRFQLSECFLVHFVVLWIHRWPICCGVCDTVK